MALVPQTEKIHNFYDFLFWFIITICGLEGFLYYCAIGCRPLQCLYILCIAYPLYIDKTIEIEQCEQ